MKTKVLLVLLVFLSVQFSAHTSTHDPEGRLVYIFSNKMILSMLEAQTLHNIAVANNWKVTFAFEGDDELDRVKLNKLNPFFQSIEILTEIPVGWKNHTRGLHYPAIFFEKPNGFSRVVYGVMPYGVWQESLKQINNESVENEK